MSAFLRPTAVATSLRLASSTSTTAASSLLPAIYGSRNFATSSIRALKEGDSEQDYEKHKQDQLQKQKQGKGHWKPELASNSEEAVQADRNNTDNESINELQKRTTGHASKKHESGTSQDGGH